MDEKPSSAPAGRDLAAIAGALVLPSLITWLYFFQAAEWDSTWQRSIFGVLKVVQFGFPIAWVLFMQGGAKGLRGEGARGISFRGLLEAVIFGAVIAAAMFVLYYGLLRNSDAILPAVVPIQKKIEGFGIDTVGKYAALSIFYSLCHSFLEEYYWRWFVFGQLRRQMNFPSAMFISAVGFMAHHVLVLGFYFGFSPGRRPSSQPQSPSAAPFGPGSTTATSRWSARG